MHYFKLIALKMSGLAGVTGIDRQSRSRRGDPPPPKLTGGVDSMCRVVLG
jgi:hypothetical protein